MGQGHGERAVPQGGEEILESPAQRYLQLKNTLLSRVRSVWEARHVLPLKRHGL